ncbi:MAG: hypothetical protein JWM28_1393 [Chitinophagaceae bacterium]|nr:hypothetical protein [Chitinophagaceae bacterium]
MKKVSVVILAILYFAISSGIIVNLHYCMNRFASADFSLVSGKFQCGECGMQKTKSHGCCHDEIKLVKLQDDQNKSSQVATGIAFLQAVAMTPSEFIVTSFYNADEINHHKEHSPPLLSRRDTYLQNCVFRI